MKGYDESSETRSIYGGQMTPTNIHKGNLKNIWLITSLMCCAEREKIIKRLIKKIDLEGPV